MRGVTTAALLLAVALACASPPPRSPAPEPRGGASPAGGSGTLDELVRKDLAQDHAFPWSATRPLTWRDFQGRPPSSGPEGAKTAYGLYSIWKCKGQAFEYRVAVAFRTQESWVKTQVLSDSMQRRTVLEHEQSHFDLGEVHARRMRQAFRELTNPCRRSEEELDAVADRFAREEREEQRRYDAETTHGLRTREQAAWTMDIRRRLAAAR